MLQLDKHTTDLLERLVMGIEKQNEQLERIEKRLESIESDNSYIESMMENSEYI